MQTWTSLIDYAPWTALLPSLALFAISFMPTRLANRKVSTVGRAVAAISLVQLVAAFCVIGLWVAFDRPSVDISILTIESIPLMQELAFKLDGPTALMFGLISFIGWVIVHYSLRYLHGDANQGRFLKQFAFTIASVNLLVWSSSLAMFTAAWFGVSIGLHALLLHFGSRAGAKRAAWLKFTVSRSGELLLVVAVAVLLSAYGTTQFSELASLAQDYSNGIDTQSSSASLAIACWLVVIAAIIKTAQFPFHAWLPQTLETPTPVSALMHAGVVNAGGFLMIRSGAWFVAEAAPLTLLTMFGTITAVYGAVVMSTQPSIKRQLAYSTVAQMGFMMLQCGMGAFSAAMLHILAHSLYKAHAFLASGSVLQERQACDVNRVPDGLPAHLHAKELLVTAPASLALFGSGAMILQAAISSKAGAMPLLMLWLLGIGYYAGIAIRSLNAAAIGRSLFIVAALTNFYAVGLWVIQQCVPNVTSTGVIPSVASVVFVFTGFVGLLAWQTGVIQRWLIATSKSEWLTAFYVHASNGFYLESIWRRVSPSRQLTGT